VPNVLHRLGGKKCPQTGGVWPLRPPSEQGWEKKGQAKGKPALVDRTREHPDIAPGVYVRSRTLNTAPPSGRATLRRRCLDEMVEVFYPAGLEVGC
jgi:hypothetical protein